MWSTIKPRFTEDLDTLIRRIPVTRSLMLAAIDAFGFGSLCLTDQDSLAPEQIIQLGVPPNRIDVTTSTSAIDGDSLWEPHFRRMGRG